MQQDQIKSIAMLFQRSPHRLQRLVDLVLHCTFGNRELLRNLLVGVSLQAAHGKHFAAFYRKVLYRFSYNPFQFGFISGRNVCRRTCFRRHLLDRQLTPGKLPEMVEYKPFCDGDHVSAEGCIFPHLLAVQPDADKGLLRHFIHFIAANVETAGKPLQPWCILLIQCPEGAGIAILQTTDQQFIIRIGFPVCHN